MRKLSNSILILFFLGCSEDTKETCTPEGQYLLEFSFFEGTCGEIESGRDSLDSLTECSASIDVNECKSYFITDECPNFYQEFTFEIVDPDFVTGEYYLETADCFGYYVFNARK